LIGGGTTVADDFDSYYKNIEYVDDVLRKMGYDARNVRILFFGGKTAEHTIVEGKATRENVLAEIGHLEQRITSDDTLVIFRCGHGTIELIFEKFGILNRGEQVPENEPARIIGTAAVMCFPDGCLSYLEFQEALRRIRARQIVVILNQCYSGQFTEMAAVLDNTVVVSQAGEVGIGFFCNYKTKRWQHPVWPFVKCLFDGLLLHSAGAPKRSLLDAFEYMQSCNPNVAGRSVRADRPLLKEEPQIKYGRNLQRGSVHIY
jgi:hypothetical protein